MNSYAYAPVLWVKLFHSTPGFDLTKDALARVVATDQAPGSWGGQDGREWEWRSAAPSSSSFWSLQALLTYVRDLVWPSAVNTADKALSQPQQPDDRDSTDPEPRPVPSNRPSPIPVHYPTLYHSRCLIEDEMRARGPHAASDPSGSLLDDGTAVDKALDSDFRVHPNHVWAIEEHSAKVYAVAVHDQWVISGSRDKTIKIWRLPDLPIDNKVLEWGPDVAHTVKEAHDGSILSLKFEVEDEVAGRDTGVIVTGSSDHTAKVWEVDWGKGRAKPGDDWEGVAVTLKATLTGHTDRVSSVALTSQYIVTCSHDQTVRSRLLFLSEPFLTVLVYERASVYDNRTVTLLHRLSPERGSLVAIAVNPDPTVHQAVVSGSLGWVTIDLASGNELARVSCEPAGSVTWSPDGKYIACGGKEGEVALYTPAGELVRQFEQNNSSMVRSVRVEPDSGTLLSAGHDCRIYFWKLDANNAYRCYDFPGQPIFQIDKSGMNLVAAAGNSVLFITYGVWMPYLGLYA